MSFHSAACATAGKSIPATRIAAASFLKHRPAFYDDNLLFDDVTMQDKIFAPYRNIIHRN